MQFKAEETANFINIFLESQPLIRAFPGCNQVELLRHSEDTTIMFTLSHWESEENLEQYRQSELFKSTWAKTKVLFREKAQAWTLEEFKP